MLHSEIHILLLFCCDFSIICKQARSYCSHCFKNCSLKLITPCSSFPLCPFSPFSLKHTNAGMQFSVIPSKYSSQINWLYSNNSLLLGRTPKYVCDFLKFIFSNGWKCILVSLHFAIEYIHKVEKAMTPHSSTLAWNIPWMEEPGGLQSMRSIRVGHD